MASDRPLEYSAAMRLAGLVRSIFVCTAILASACGSVANDAGATDASASFSGLAIASTTSAPSGWTVAMRSSPATPVRGTNALELVVRDATGAVVPGLTVAVVPWMPAMGHGASVSPVVTDMGGGTYVVTDVAMVMAGTWELRLTLTNAATGAQEHATISLSIS